MELSWKDHVEIQRIATRCAAEALRVYKGDSPWFFSNEYPEKYDDFVSSKAVKFLTTNRYSIGMASFSCSSELKEEDRYRKIPDNCTIEISKEIHIVNHTKQGGSFAYAVFFRIGEERHWRMYVGVGAKNGINYKFLDQEAKILVTALNSSVHILQKIRHFFFG